MMETESFDTVVDTLTISSAYDKNAHISEIKRLVKPGGLVLLMERGASYLSPYN